MTLAPPSAEDVRRAGDELGLTLSETDVHEFRELVAGAVETLRPLDELREEPAPPQHPRAWRYPDPAEDVLHGWYVKTEIHGAPKGPLAGRGVVLKDTICLAGVPMMVGASTLEGYVADVDATVVTRILAAGGTILGKANCEYFCYSAGSHTNATGPTHNPYRHGHSSGGSSSGCGALVGAGEVEFALGGDQGGSIRQPSALCGVYGLKPTHGLVPYTGVFPVDHTLDHLGPMTSTVAGNALLLEVIAGDDGVDPRQRAPRVDRYTAALERGVDGLRVGVLAEGFGHPTAQPPVEAAVHALAGRLADLGAAVSAVSVPLHREAAVAVWAAIVIGGSGDLAMRDNGVGAGHADRHVLSLLARHSQWHGQADRLSEPVKAGLIAAHYLRRAYGGLYYARAQNLARRVRDAYDEALAGVDLLLLPTMPFTAPPLPSPDAGRAEQSAPGFDAVVNTAPFNVSGHPALSLPCGMHDGLPIGAMLVGRHWEESTIYRAAAAVERSGDWHTW
jgi:amidase